MSRCAKCDHPRSAHEPGGGPCLWHWRTPERGAGEIAYCSCDGWEQRGGLERVAQTTLDEDPLEALEREVEELRERLGVSR